MYLSVCIDVAARGLDVKEVQLVVNFDMPNNIEVYIHAVNYTKYYTRLHAYTYTLIYTCMYVYSLVGLCASHRSYRTSRSDRLGCILLH